MVAMVPIDQIPAIWQRQREVSEDVIACGLTERWRKNHAENGSSPTIWLQDDRWPATHVVADVFWNWAAVVNVLALPTSEHKAFVHDSFDDLPIDPQRLGRDQGKRMKAGRSGYPRDPKVRAAVLVCLSAHARIYFSSRLSADRPRNRQTPCRQINSYIYCVGP